MTTDIVFAYPYISGRLESPIYGLLWLTGYLREKGYSVGYVDETTADSNLDIAHQVLALKPRYVGISCTTRSYPSARDLLYTLFRLKPEVKLILGGVHATFMGQTCLDELPWLDYVVAGDGFNPLERILQEEVDVKTFINGGVSTDINSLSLPAWDLVDLFRYSGNYPVLKDNSTTTFSSIGCPNACAFCSLHYKKPRFRDPGLLVEELVYLNREKGVREVFLYDDEFNLSPSHAVDVCAAIIDFSGGEPTLFKGLHNLINRLDEKHALALSANLQDERGFRILADKTDPARLFSVTCSWHKEGRLTPNRFLGRVLVLKRRGFPVHINVVRNPVYRLGFLQKDWRDVMNFRSNGVKVHISPFEDVRKIRINHETLICNAGVNTFTMSPRGDIYRCLTWFRSRWREEAKLGNLFDGTFKPLEGEETCNLHCDIYYLLDREHAQKGMFSTHVRRF